jgi:WD40 repeat protein
MAAAVELETMQDASDIFPYLGGLKVSAQVMGLSVHYPTRTVAMAISRLDGDIWDGCVELWEMSALIESQENQSTPKACSGRRPLPCGVSGVKWFCDGDGKPLLAVGRDNGDVDVLQWDTRNRKLNLMFSLTEHDDMINCVATSVVDFGNPQYDSYLTSGSADGSVRVWNVAGPNPQSAMRTLPSPFYGASVQAVTPAAWGKKLDVLLVAYGGSSGQKGPGFGLWDCSQGLLQPPTFVFTASGNPGSTLGSNYIDKCATPLSLCYSKDPERSHEFVVGFDDGTIAIYSDLDLTQPISVSKPHGSCAIRSLDTLLLKGSRCVIYSASESCSAMITEWDLSSSGVVDSRADYVLNITCGEMKDHKSLVITGGMEGQVRLIDVSKA